MFTLHLSLIQAIIVKVVGEDVIEMDRESYRPTTTLDEFAAAWANGEKPQIKSFLQATERSEHSLTTEELIKIVALT